MPRPNTAAASPSHTVPPKKTAKAPAARTLPLQITRKGLRPAVTWSTRARSSDRGRGSAQHSRLSSLSRSSRTKSVLLPERMRRVSVAASSPGNSMVMLMMEVITNTSIRPAP